MDGVGEEQLIEKIQDSAGVLRGAETPVQAMEELITPTSLFYIVHHYDTPPPVYPGTWSARVEGHVSQPLEIGYEQLRSMPSRTVMALAECTGNSRKYLSPETIGAQWGDGLVSAAEWTGVPMGAALRLAGIGNGAHQVVVEGTDSGTAEPEHVAATFAKGLPLDKALHPDTLLAWAMNGELLDHLHGAPIRLIVPGWFGVWWVKWVSRIEVIDRPFEGFWQSERYTYQCPDDEERPLVTTQHVKSLICRPAEGTEVSRGRQLISGRAWSGRGNITRVEVSTDGGSSWRSAALSAPESAWMWTRWEYEWEPTEKGEASLMARATDATGEVQPERIRWNRHGYGNNAIRARNVTVG